jgi:hypothetical protein
MGHSHVSSFVAAEAQSVLTGSPPAPLQLKPEALGTRQTVICVAAVPIALSLEHFLSQEAGSFSV